MEFTHPPPSGEAPERASLPGDRSQAASVGRTLSADEVVVAFHERTKHHHHRYAASLGYMDWASQPDPFRRYRGASLVPLPFPEAHRATPYWQLYVADCIESFPLSLDSISLFFRYALSLTAWKRAQGATWSLRANPSSGNLHPTEGYALLPSLDASCDRAGIYHYAPKEHGLERRAELAPSLWTALMSAYPKDSFLVGLSSVHWREAWKYGERAFRYCQHDVGHALGTMRFAAAALGWRLSLLDGVSDSAISRLLGLDRDADYAGAERERPELLALVTQRAWTDPRGRQLPERIVQQVTTATWHGEANTLSSSHGVDWPVIDAVAIATSNAGIALDEDFSRCPSEEELFEQPVRSGTYTAERVILGRRSAVSMDASTAISAATFFQMMARLLPTRGARSAPWDAIPWRPRIHLGLFVHRVNDLPPGLYALARDPAMVEPLRNAMRQEFRWWRLPSCPSGLPLYLLKEGDCRDLAASVSCGQAIAGDGAFSLGMFADYMGSLVSCGATFYRNLHWEAGLVGQVLYLEAEEAGIRATGLGCYFDESVHDVFGLSSRDWQSLYHFTVGGPVEDTRLTTLPAYLVKEASRGRQQR